MKMELTLKNRKLTTIGGSQGFIVDKAFIKNEQLKKDELYDLNITLSKHQEPMQRRKPKSPLSDKAKFIKDNELEE